MAHGGVATFGAAAVSPNVSAGGPQAKPIDPRYFQGFSYFLGPPSEGQRSALGANPLLARRSLVALYGLLPNSPLSVEQLSNKQIPAGYTYLLQMIAHDLVDSTVPFWIAAEAGIASRNSRGIRLQLDTLYGGGPTSCPIAFKAAGPWPDLRSSLRLGRMSDADAPGMSGGACPFRDLPRLKLNRKPQGASAKDPAPTNFDEVWLDANAPARVNPLLDDAAQVFIADVRNDDVLTLTQVVVLFSILHNAIAAKLDQVNPPARFALARAAMLRMYHSVIRNDVLPRILHDEVLRALKDRPASSPEWLWDGQDVPLEFSHGAFRFGHAMVNASYVFNDRAPQPFSIKEVLGGPSVGNSVRDPLPSSWVVAWSKFFQFPGMGEPNFSLKFAVRNQMPLDINDLMPRIGNDPPKNISIRDWMSAAAARMARPDALIAAIKEKYKGLAFVSPDTFQKWFADLAAVRGMADFPDEVRADPAILTNDLPLPLYVMLEAQFDPIASGERLGPLGSILVGEVLFRCLTEAEDVQSLILPVAQQALGHEAWTSIDGVKTMPDLIQLARDWGGLADCQKVPFIGNPSSPG